MRMSPSTSEDQAILQQVPFMCSLLGLKKTSPHKLFWQEKIYGGTITTSVPADYLHVDRGRLTLAKRLQGILTTDEWRPLIGSILVLRSWARPRPFRALATSIIAIVLYYAEVLYLAGQDLLGTFSGGTVLLLLFPFLVPTIIVLLIFLMFTWRSGTDARNDVLKADRQVAGVIGFERFLTVLQKIDNTGFKDDRHILPRGLRSRQPSIKERIQHLQYCLTNRNT